MSDINMTKVITAVEPIPKLGFKVFLAGAIDMGNAVNWQLDVISRLSQFSSLVLVNPRRSNFTKDTLDEQIYWELDALEQVDAVFMWFPKDAKAPISFLETGLYLASGKLMIGAEDGFYRRRNLEITCRRYQVPLHKTLEGLCMETIHQYGYQYGRWVRKSEDILNEVFKLAKAVDIESNTG